MRNTMCAGMLLLQLSANALPAQIVKKAYSVDNGQTVTVPGKYTMQDGVTRISDFDNEGIDVEKSEEQEAAEYQQNYGLNKMKQAAEQAIFAARKVVKQKEKARAAEKAREQEEVENKGPQDEWVNHLPTKYPKGFLSGFRKGFQSGFKEAEHRVRMLQTADRGVGAWEPESKAIIPTADEIALRLKRGNEKVRDLMFQYAGKYNVMLRKLAARSPEAASRVPSGQEVMREIMQSTPGQSMKPTGATDATPTQDKIKPPPEGTKEPVPGGTNPLSGKAPGKPPKDEGGVQG